MAKKYRNGNGLLESAKDATGRAAETLRETIRWNTAREKVATAQGRLSDAARHAANRANCQIGLLRIAQEQAA